MSDKVKKLQLLGSVGSELPEFDIRNVFESIDSDDTRAVPVTQDVAEKFRTCVKNGVFMGVFDWVGEIVRALFICSELSDYQCTAHTIINGMMYVEIDCYSDNVMRITFDDFGQELVNNVVSDLDSKIAGIRDDYVVYAKGYVNGPDDYSIDKILPFNIATLRQTVQRRGVVKLNLYDDDSVYREFILSTHTTDDDLIVFKGIHGSTLYTISFYASDIADVAVKVYPIYKDTAVGMCIIEAEGDMNNTTYDFSDLEIKGVYLDGVFAETFTYETIHDAIHSNKHVALRLWDCDLQWKEFQLDRDQEDELAVYFSRVETKAGDEQKDIHISICVESNTSSRALVYEIGYQPLVVYLQYSDSVTTDGQYEGPGYTTTRSSEEIRNALEIGRPVVGYLRNSNRALEAIAPMTFAKEGSMFEQTGYGDSIGLPTLGYWHAMTGDNRDFIDRHGYIIFREC